MQIDDEDYSQETWEECQKVFEGEGCSKLLLRKYLLVKHAAHEQGRIAKHTHHTNVKLWEVLYLGFVVVPEGREGGDQKTLE